MRVLIENKLSNFEDAELLSHPDASSYDSLSLMNEALKTELPSPAC